MGAIVAAVTVVACGFDSQGNDVPPAPGLGVEPSTGEAPDPGAPSDDTEGGGAGLSAGESGAGSSNGDPTAGDPTSPTTTSTTGADDPADVGPQTDGDPDATEGPTDDGDGGSTPTEAVVHNTDLSQCSAEVGCWGAIPAGPFTVLECFESPVAPPYRVEAFTFDVAWIAPAFDDLEIRVYEASAVGLPSASVWAGSLTAAPASGVNEIPFGGEAPTVETSGFCLSLRIPDGGWDGGLNFGVNPDAPASSGSYFGNCGVTEWTALGSSWCIAAHVRAQ